MQNTFTLKWNFLVWLAYTRMGTNPIGETCRYSAQSQKIHHSQFRWLAIFVPFFSVFLSLALFLTISRSLSRSLTNHQLHKMTHELNQKMPNIFKWNENWIPSKCWLNSIFKVKITWTTKNKKWCGWEQKKNSCNTIVSQCFQFHCTVNRSPVGVRGVGEYHYFYWKFHFRHIFQLNRSFPPTTETFPAEPEKLNAFFFIVIPVAFFYTTAAIVSLFDSLFLCYHIKWFDA